MVPTAAVEVLSAAWHHAGVMLPSLLPCSPSQPAHTFRQILILFSTAAANFGCNSGEGPSASSRVQEFNLRILRNKNTFCLQIFRTQGLSVLEKTNARSKVSEQWLHQAGLSYTPCSQTIALSALQSHWSRFNLEFRVYISV